MVEENRVILKYMGQIDPESLDDYLSIGGFQALRKALKMRRSEIIGEINESRLRGRGGAAFWTGFKWESVAVQTRRPKYMVCNSDEGEPGTFKDRYVWETVPFQVLEGMIIGAIATGIDYGFVYVRGEYPWIYRRVEKLVNILRDEGYLGSSILGSGYSFDIEVVQGAGAYVCGESSAILESIEGKRGGPRVKPPRTSVVGLFGQPTLVQNVETLANVPLIIKNGGKWYASMGTSSSTGTRIFSISGLVKKPGPYEIELGSATLGEAIQLAGGVDGELKGVIIGGASGYIVPPDFLNMPLTMEDAERRGISLGSGVIVPFTSDISVVDVVLNTMRFFEQESCGRCTPCRGGTREVVEIIEKLVRGKGTKEHISLLKRWGKTMMNASICGLGKSAPNMLLSSLKYFRNEWESLVG